MTTEVCPSYFNISKWTCGDLETGIHYEINASWKILLSAVDVIKYQHEFRERIKFTDNSDTVPFDVICKIEETEEIDSESKVILWVELSNNEDAENIKTCLLYVMLDNMFLIPGERSEDMEVMGNVAKLTWEKNKFRSRYDSGFEIMAKFKQTKHVEDERKKESNNILTDFEKMLTMDNFSDVKLTFDNNLEIKAHKCVLSVRSSFFERILRTGDVTEIKIKNVSYEIMRMAIKYMYCSQLKDQNLADAIKLLKAATLYEIPELVNKCEKIVLQQFEIKDMIFMLDLATALKLDNFKFNILSKCKENISKVTDEQISLLHEKHPEFARFIV